MWALQDLELHDLDLGAVGGHSIRLLSIPTASFRAILSLRCLTCGVELGEKLYDRLYGANELEYKIWVNKKIEEHMAPHPVAASPETLPVHLL